MNTQPLALFAALLFLSANASAATYNSDHVTIDAATAYQHSYFSSLDHVAPFEIISDGISFSPSEHIGAQSYCDPFAYPLFCAGDKSGELAFAVENLRFMAKRGFEITGYEFSFSGRVMTEELGQASIAGSMMNTNYQGLQQFGGWADWKSYSFSTAIDADLVADGRVQAYGRLTYAAPIGFSEWLGEDAIPQYWVYGGRADVTLDNVTIRAFVAPIPEPETYLMFLVGIGAIAWRARRSKGNMLESA